MSRGWSEEEDKKLLEGVKAFSCPQCDKQYIADCPCGNFLYHTRAWTQISVDHVKTRTSGACQGRYLKVHDPNLDNSPWTPELDAKLLALYNDPEYNTWVKRAKALTPGKRRSGADVADRYFKLQKEMKKKGQKRKEVTKETANKSRKPDQDKPKKKHRST